MMIPESPSTPRSPRRVNRRRANSSLSDMFASPMESVGTPTSRPRSDSLPSIMLEKEKLSEEDQTLRTMTRSLRKAKRQLLLRSVEEPENNVDRLRDIIMKITISDDSESSNDSLLMPTE